MSRLRAYMMDEAAATVRRMARLRKPQRDSFDKVEELFRRLDDDYAVMPLGRLYEQMEDAGYRVDGLPPQLVFNLATGVGKTRLMGALIAYLYLAGQSKNFLILAPRAAILEKLERESSQHDAKYLLIDPDLLPEPNVCIRDNLDSFRPNSDELNLFILSPQSISGSEKRFSRPSEFRSESLAEYLTGCDDLVVFVDEAHHLGDLKKERASWTQAIHDLKPRVYFGLTATLRSPEPAPGLTVVHSYDLGQCIRDERYTKAVTLMVEPKDDNLDDDEWDHYTLDFALERLDRKQQAIDAQRQMNPAFPDIRPVALICAADTKHADKVGAWLKEHRGLSDEEVLVTHSEKRLTEDEIRRLVSIDSPGNPIRVVVNVFSLTEGWDVTNVYVIAPLRTMATFTGALQTIGRGLRLPAGARVGDQDVDTLDVLCCGKESLQSILNQAIAEFGDPDGSGSPPIGLGTKSEIEDTEQPIPTRRYMIESLRDVKVHIPRMRLDPGVVPLDFDIESAGSIGQTSVVTLDLKDLQTGGLSDGFRFRLDDLVRIAAAHTIAEIPNGLSTFRHTQQVQDLIRRYLIASGADEDALLKLDPVRLAKFTADQIERRMVKAKSTLVNEGGSVAVTFPSYECLVTDEFDQPLNKNDMVWSSAAVRVPIGGWIKCIHASARFDTQGEYRTAGILDQSKAINWWSRNDPARVKVPTPIGGFEPDFFYATTNGDYGLLELKGDVLWSPEGSDARVKSEAAKNWVASINSVSKDANWHYSLVIDDDISGKIALEELLKVAADRSLIE